MLARLSIYNYAIIQELEIDFSDKLNIITGETGAGKSIIMGALHLILGERADTSALVNKEKKCVIEGVFKNGHKKEVKDFLAAHELDVEEELVIRREIGANGKSRAFVNDTPVVLTQLQQLSSLLVDMHQQFDTLQLGETDFQRQVLDALAGQQAAMEQYQTDYKKWLLLKKETDALKTKQHLFEKEADYNRFQYTELADAGFYANELEEAETDLKLLSNSEGIKAALDKAYFELAESETPIVQQLKTLINQLHHYETLHSALPALLQRLQSTQVELQDIGGEIDHINQQINYDPQRIDSLNERLSIGYKLQKKHGLSSTAALLELQNQLAQKLQDVLNIEADIAAKEKETHAAYTQLQQQADKITAARKKQIKPLQDNVNKLLHQVGMPNAQLKVVVEGTTLCATGGDAIEFLFDANKSNRFLPISKVASGGELSRLMLCIKSLVAQSVDLSTLIFDEIDTGISGEAARQVGIIMKGLAMRRQVICITHQPQIAGKADAHFFVYKKIEKDNVQTYIRQLTTDERIISIAQMLSGEKPTAAALENAKEMVMN